MPREDLLQRFATVREANLQTAKELRVEADRLRKAAQACDKAADRLQSMMAVTGSRLR